MVARKQESELLDAMSKEQEAGVADLLELYERIEDIYIQASASIPESAVIYTSDSTNVVGSSA